MTYDFEKLFSGQCNSNTPVASIDTSDLRANIKTAIENNEWVWCGLDVINDTEGSLRLGWENDSNPDFFTVATLTVSLEVDDQHIQVLSGVIDEVVVINPDGEKKRVYAHNLSILDLLDAIAGEFHLLNMAIVQNKVTPTNKIHSVVRREFLEAQLMNYPPPKEVGVSWVIP